MVPLYESVAALAQKTTIRLSLFQEVVYSDFTSLKETSGVKSCFVYFKGYLDFWILIQMGLRVTISFI